MQIKVKVQLTRSRYTEERIIDQMATLKPEVIEICIYKLCICYFRINEVCTTRFDVFKHRSLDGAVLKDDVVQNDVLESAVDEARLNISNVLDAFVEFMTFVIYSCVIFCFSPVFLVF